MAALNKLSARTPFDYRSLPRAVADDLKERAKNIRLRVERSTRDMLKNGQDLLVAKEHLVKHGEFAGYLNEEGIDPKGAQRWMASAKLVTKYDNLSTLDKSAIYRLARKSTPVEVIENVVAQVDAGAEVRDKDVRELLSKTGSADQKNDAGRRETRRVAEKLLIALGAINAQRVVDAVRKDAHVVDALARAIREQRPRKPKSVTRYLVDRGGLRAVPELTRVLDGQYGWLIRRDGMTLDRAREACVEGGYLPETPWEGGVSTSTIDDLLQLIDTEVRGAKQYPYGYLPSEIDLTEGNGIGEDVVHENVALESWERAGVGADRHNDDLDAANSNASTILHFKHRSVFKFSFPIDLS